LLLYRSQLSRIEVRFGAVSAKSLIIFVEVRTNSYYGYSGKIRITCLRAVWSLAVLIIHKNCSSKEVKEVVRAYIPYPKGIGVLRPIYKCRCKLVFEDIAKERFYENN